MYELDQHDWPRVFGLTLAPFDFQQSLDAVAGLIDSHEPAYFITANLHYAQLSSLDEGLQRVNDEAAFLLADGMPLVWASRGLDVPLRERVAGSDLTPALCRQAAERGDRVFLLGAMPGVGDSAADELQKRFPGLEIAGVYSPEPGEVEPAGDDALVERIREAEPQLLFAALGQPKGELWIHRNFRKLGPMVSVQIGATLDFVAGRISRAPVWMQKTGLEWVYRAGREPMRLGPRYAQDLWFLGSKMLRRSTKTRA